MDLFLAEIIPEVTVPPKPNGLPIAITQSPILALSESPNWTGINFSFESIWRTAISDKGSAPIIVALYSLSPPTLTTISSESLITWLLVITIPFSSIINPEPNAADFLVCGVPNSLNISSKGDPGGNWNPGNGLALVVTVVVDVEIFTTDGINLSAKSANDVGAALTFICSTRVTVKNTINNFLILFILIFNINLLPTRESNKNFVTTRLQNKGYYEKYWWYLRTL